jgi:hypothetical protein
MSSHNDNEPHERAWRSRAQQIFEGLQRYVLSRKRPIRKRNRLDPSERPEHDPATRRYLYERLLDDPEAVIEIRCEPGQGKSADMLRPTIDPKRLSKLLAFYAGLRGISPRRLASDVDFTMQFINSLSPQQQLAMGCWDREVVQAAMLRLQKHFRYNN